MDKDNPTAIKYSDPSQNLQNDPNTPTISWTSKDGFSYQKGLRWYFIFMLLVVIVAIVIYLTTKDKITTAVIVVSGIILAVYSSRKPRDVNYSINQYGFKIKDREYKLGNYKSFSIIKHDANNLSIVLTPLKRFLPYAYLYLGDNSQQVIEMVGRILPLEKKNNDFLERLLRYIKI
jgi:hypothetical protein